ncbi:MAG: phosphatase PAP2 family protein [Bdellovibrionota bacterium]
MTNVLDPLQTRCLPESFCLRFPQSWVNWDSALREAWVVPPGDHRLVIESLRWLVESAGGIALIALVFMTVFWRCFQWPRLPGPKRFAFMCLAMILGAGLSDLASMGLKIFFGRLKPHVTYYNPRVLPALSFPSNHAFNTTFLCALFFFESRRLKERFSGGRSAFGIFLVLLLVFIGFSRVILGEHYPLDVVAGLLFGLGFAALYSCLIKLVMSKKPL